MDFVFLDDLGCNTYLVYRFPHNRRLDKANRQSSGNSHLYDDVSCCNYLRHTTQFFRDRTTYREARISFKRSIDFYSYSPGIRRISRAVGLAVYDRAISIARMDSHSILSFDIFIAAHTHWISRLFDKLQRKKQRSNGEQSAAPNAWIGRLLVENFSCSRSVIGVVQAFTRIGRTRSQ